MHESSSHEFRQKLMDVKKYKNVEYSLKDGKNGKHVDFIIDKISLHTFMKDFKSKILPKYVNTPNMLGGLIVNFTYVKIYFQLELYYRWLTLQKTIFLHHKKKSNLNIINHYKLFLFILYIDMQMIVHKII